MKISKFILVLLIIILSSCKEKSAEAKIILIKASRDKFEHFDTIYGKDISRSDSIMFWYDNDDFKGSIDTLLFMKDRTQFMGKTLEFVRKKKYTVNEENVEIEKYYYHGDGFHSFNIFYINSKKGIVLNTTHSDMIIEYDFVKNKSLINQIKSDSLFFGYE